MRFRHSHETVSSFSAVSLLNFHSELFAMQTSRLWRAKSIMGARYFLIALLSATGWACKVHIVHTWLTAPTHKTHVANNPLTNVGCHEEKCMLSSIIVTHLEFTKCGTSLATHASRRLFHEFDFFSIPILTTSCVIFLTFLLEWIPHKIQSISFRIYSVAVCSLCSLRDSATNYANCLRVFRICFQTCGFLTFFQHSSTYYQ